MYVSVRKRKEVKEREREYVSVRESVCAHVCIYEFLFKQRQRDVAQLLT